jgi:hypothetical protein
MRRAPAGSDHLDILQDLAAWNDPGSVLAARAVLAATGTALAATTEGADTIQAAEATWVAAEADSGARRSAMATGRAQAAWPMCLQANPRCHLGAPRARVASACRAGPAPSCVRAVACAWAAE